MKVERGMERGAFVHRRIRGNTYLSGLPAIGLPSSPLHNIHLFLSPTMVRAPLMPSLTLPSLSREWSRQDQTGLSTVHSPPVPSRLPSPLLPSLLSLLHHPALPCPARPVFSPSTPTPHFASNQRKQRSKPRTSGPSLNASSYPRHSQSHPHLIPSHVPSVPIVHLSVL